MDRRLLHDAQTKNRAEIARANRQHLRTLNAYIKARDDLQTAIHLRLAVLMRMAWLEASALWLASHPRLSDLDGATILSRKTHAEKWRTLIVILKGKQPASRARDCDVLLEWANTEIAAYTELRNKLAHGQWRVCLSNSGKRNRTLEERVVSLGKHDELAVRAFSEALVDLVFLLIVNTSGFDVEYPKALHRIEHARRYYLSNIDWLLTEMRRRTRNPRK